VSGAEPEEPEVRDEYAAAVTDKDMGNLPATVQQKAKLAPDLPGQLRQAAGSFRGYDLLCTGFAPAETFDLLELTGLKAGGFSLYFCYGFLQEWYSKISIQQSDENRSSFKSCRILFTAEDAEGRGGRPTILCTSAPVHWCTHNIWNLEFSLRIICNGNKEGCSNFEHWTLGVGLSLSKSLQ
jgi:hypothetical protein